MAKILHLLLGWNMNYSIWVASLTVAVYVTMAGLISAVFNEVVQFFLIWLGTLLIPILGIIDAGGWSKMVETIQRNVHVIHPTLQDPNFTSLWRNLGSFDNPMGVDWIGIVFGFSVSRIRLLVYRLLAGAAGDRGEKPSLGAKRHAHRRRAENVRAVYRHPARPAGTGRADQSRPFADGSWFPKTTPGRISRSIPTTTCFRC